MIGMKFIAIMVVLILVIAALFIIPIGMGEEVEAPFGDWRISVDVETTDGKTVPLSTVTTMGAQMLSVFAGGTEISTITYKVEARATGSGFTHCELDLSQARFSMMVDDKKVGRNGEANIMLPLDGDYQTVFELKGEWLVENLDALLPGDYTVTFGLSQGSYKFRGVGDVNGDWQTSTSMPTTTLDISVTQDQNCYRCDGAGGIESRDANPDGSCPSGWDHESYFDSSKCACWWEPDYDSWSMWSPIGCHSTKDCYRREQRTRKVYNAKYCRPNIHTPVERVYTHTQTEYRNVYSSSCCAPSSTITCYKCDGAGTKLSQTVTGTTCPSGWDSNPMNCQCYWHYKYGDWSSWEFINCVGKYGLYRRTRIRYRGWTCPGFTGHVNYQQYSTETEEKIMASAYCYLFPKYQIMGLTFNIQTTPYEPYMLNSNYYLGRI
jgi:hypothetical protein